MVKLRNDGIVRGVCITFLKFVRCFNFIKILVIDIKYESTIVKII